jgi:hypothetical protein
MAIKKQCANCMCINEIHNLTCIMCGNELAVARLPKGYTKNEKILPSLLDHKRIRHLTKDEFPTRMI